MNYLSAGTCFLDQPGGAERVAWDTAVAMRDRGHDVAIICPRKKPEDDHSAMSESHGMRIVRYNHPRLPSWHPRRGERAIQAAADATRKWLGDQKWDVVHIHMPLTGAGVMSALGHGPRYIYTMHSPVVLEQRINWAHQGISGRLKLALGLGRIKRLESDLLNKCAGIQTLSEFTRREVGRFHGLADQVTVVPHWRRSDLKRTHTKEQARRLLGWPEDQKILFTVRRHASRYGLDIAIRAITPLAAQGRCIFVLAGDGPLRPSFEALAKELGGDGNVRFTGRISDEELALSYEAADLFILPTTELECFGLITLEAFAFGCPVLSTDSCALPETMQPILPEFIVPAGDVDALRQKVDDFLTGKLVPPPPEQLVEYLADRYDESVVLPDLAKLLEGESRPKQLVPLS